MFCSYHVLFCSCPTVQCSGDLLVLLCRFTKQVSSCICCICGTLVLYWLLYGSALIGCRSDLLYSRVGRHCQSISFAFNLE
jgi:hypothetical protein